MSTSPSTIPGWQTRGYQFLHCESDEPYCYEVLAPDGTTLGTVGGDVPEAATARACELAGAHARTQPG